MSNCDNDVNSQLKALHARLDRIDEDLISHHAAGYLQAISFMSNPVTFNQGVAMAAQYVSRQAFKELAKLLPFYEELKQLMHIDAAALVEGLGDSLEAQALGIVNQAIDQTKEAIRNKIDAEIAHAEAVAAGAIEEVVAPLRNALEKALEKEKLAIQAANQIKAFLDTLLKIAKCKSETAVLKKPDIPDADLNTLAHLPDIPNFS